MCHTHVGSTEKNFLPQKIKHASACFLLLDYSTIRTLNNLSICPLLQPRTFAICSIRVFALQPSARAYLPSSQSLSLRKYSSYAPPSTHNPLHPAKKTTQALPNDDAVADTTTDGQKRNGRDLTVRAEHATLGLRPSQLGKLSSPAHDSRAPTSRWPT